MLGKLVNLNSVQNQAVNHRQGPLLLVAGAGTGKTMVLVRRLVEILETEKLDSDRILLLTFTEKAAAEMEERADKLLPYGYLDLWINTFHAFCERILREHSLDIGLPADFKILNSTEQWILLKNNLSLFNLKYYQPLGNPTKFISEILKHFSKLKDENIDPIEYLKTVNEMEFDEADVQEHEGMTEKDRLLELAGAYQTYNSLLLENSLLDFGDLITYTLKLFKQRPRLLKQYRDKFIYVMVDEFQDTNWAQYELVKVLAAPNNNLMVVGDDDQAIYRFRGASLANIMQFKEDFPKAIELVLTENYRSSQNILDLAYRFIAHNNPNRLEEKLSISKKLISRGNLNQDTYPPRFISLAREEDEIAFVAEKIIEIYKREEKKDEGVLWSNFAILARSNSTAEKYVKELTRRGVPNQFISLRGLYYKTIILDCLAYLRLLNDYHESSALFRVLNISPFRIPQSDIIALNRFARRKAWSLYESLGQSRLVPDLSEESKQPIEHLLKLIETHSALVPSTLVSRLFFNFVEESGILKGLDIDRDQDIFSYLNQFYQKIKKLEAGAPDLRLPDFLKAIDLELEAGDTGSLKLDYEDDEAVKIMTVHAAKGLEFPYVFLVNLADKKFPTINRSDKIPIPESLVKEILVNSKDAHIEEERRLFYVALTRAKRELYITCAKDYGGVKEKKASQFIEETGLKPEYHDLGILNNELLRDLQDQGADFLQEKLVVENLPSKFSFSQLAAYETCPLQYKYAFILKIPAPFDKASLVFGRVMHSVFYDFLKPLASSSQGTLFEEDVDKKLFNLKQLNKILHQRWQNDGYENSEQREEYWQKAQVAIKKFFELFILNQDALPKPLFLEKNFSFKIAGETIKGTIDRVDELVGGVEIIDYKTGNPKNKKDINWKEKRQLILYQLFLEDVLHLKVLSLRYYYVEDASSVSFLATEKEKEKLRDTIVTQIKAIKAHNFVAKPSIMCNFCDFNKICEFRQVNP